MLIYPQSQEVYPVGALIQAKSPPSNRWERCYGQVVAQADYPTLFNKMKNPHSCRWNNRELVLFFENGEQYNSIATDGTNYVLVGGYSVVGYSTDLVNWTHITPVVGNWRNIVYGNGIFLVGGYASTVAAVSSDGGVNWTSKTLPQSKYWWHCCWDGTYFWYAATNYNKVCRSTDGNSWTEVNTVTTATSGWLGYNGMASDGAGTIVVHHNSGTLGVSTDNGATWSVIPFEYSVCDIAYVNGKFIISTYKGFICTSDDGTSWDCVQVFSSDDPRFYHTPRQTVLARWKYGNGMYVASGGMEGNIKFYLYSYDLKTFEAIFSIDNGSRYMYDHIWDAANERWMFFTDEGYVLFVSEFNYDENTYFQFPYVSGDHQREHGKEWYIRVR